MLKEASGADVLCPVYILTSLNKYFHHRCMPILSCQIQGSLLISSSGFKSSTLHQEFLKAHKIGHSKGSQLLWEAILIPQPQHFIPITTERKKGWNLRHICLENQKFMFTNITIKTFDSWVTDRRVLSTLLKLPIYCNLLSCKSINAVQH